MSPRMKEWIIHYKKLNYTLLVVVFITILLLRMFVVPELLPSSKDTDWLSISRSVLDALIATVLVTTSVTLAFWWTRPPQSEGGTDAFIQPFEVGQSLRNAAISSREWYYLGQTARYVRSRILPMFADEAKSRNEKRIVRVMLINPQNDTACKYYAEYRSVCRSADLDSKDWTEGRAKSEVLATVLCCLELKSKNPNLEVGVGFLTYVSLFRIDFSQSLVLITQEDGQEPAIRYYNHSRFYDSYRREIEMAWDQCERLNLANVPQNFDYANLEEVKDALSNSGVNIDVFDEDIINEAVNLAKRKKSPYAH